MAGLEGIRACVFDAYGTLFDVGSPVQKLATEIGDKAADLAAAVAAEAAGIHLAPQPHGGACGFLACDRRCAGFFAGGLED